MKTGFIKNVSLLLAASIAAFGITLPVMADEPTVTAETVLLDQDFENCAALNDTGFSFWPGVGEADGQLTELADLDGNKALKLTTSDKTTGDPWYSNAAQVFLMEEGSLAQYTDGYMNVTFDVAPGLRGDQGTFEFQFRTKDGDNNADIGVPKMVWEQAILNDWDHTIVGADGSRLTSGSWYTIINEFDFTNKTITTEIKDKANGTQLGKGTYTYTTTPSTLYFYQYDSKNTGLENKLSSYVDNVKVVYSKEVTDDPKPSPTETDEPVGIEWEDNFDSYTSNYDLTANGKYSIPTEWGFDASTVSVAANGNGKALKLEPATNGQSVVLRSINSKTTGKVGIDVEITPGSANDNKLVVGDSSWGNEIILSFNGDSVNIRQGNDWNKIGSFTQGETYKVRMIADLDNDKLDIAVIDKNNKTIRGSAVYAGNDIGSLQLGVGAWENTNGSALFDNLKITANPTALPDATPEETADPTETEGPKPSPTATDEPAGIEWEDNFDSYTSNSDLTADGKYSIPNGWGGDISAVSVVTNGEGKALKLEPASNAQIVLLRTISSETSGKVGIDVEVTPGSADDNMLVISDSSWGNETVFSFNTDTIHIRQGNDWNKIGSFTQGETYKVRIIADLDNDTIEVAVTDKNDKTIRGSAAYAGNDIGALQMRVGAWNNKNGFALFDNLKITSDPTALPDATPEETADPTETEGPKPSPTATDEPAGIEWEDNFDSYTSNSDLTADGKYSIPTEWGFDASTVSVAANGNGKALKLEPATNGQSVVLRSINSKTTGKVGIDVEITPGSANDNKLVVGDSSWGNEIILSFNGDSVNIRQGNDWNKIGSFTPGETYKVRMIAELDNDKLDIAVTDKNGKTIRGSAAYAGNDIGSLQMGVGAWENTSGSALFDNLKITADPVVLPDATPEATDDPTAKKTLWEDDFESYSDINGVKTKYSNWPNVWRSSVESDNGSKVLSVMPNDKVDSSLTEPDWQQKTVQFYKQLDKTYTSGRLGFSFSVKPARSGNTNFILRLEGGYEIVAPRFAGQTVLLGTDGDCWNNSIGQIKPDTWYDVIVNLDLDKDELEIQVSDTDGNKIRGTQEYTGDFNCFLMGVYSDEFDGAMFDNLKVVVNPDELPEIQELPFEDNFNGYNTIADAGINWSCWAPESNTNPSKIIEGKDGGADKAYYLGLSQGTDSTTATKKFVDPITTGKLKVEFDIKPGANVATHVKFDTTGTGNSDNKGFLPIMYFENGKVGTVWNWVDNNTSIGTYTPDNWYRCSAELDFDRGYIKVQVEDKNGTIQSKTVSYEDLREVDYESITTFTFQEYSAAAAAVGSVFDNVKIEYVVTDPAIDPTGISFMTGETVSTDTAKVPVSADKILLDFGTSMDLTTFDGMMLTYGNGSEVSYKLANVNGKVALELKEALQPLTEYTLHIPDTAANIKGTELGISEDITFTSGEGGFTGILSGIKSGETEITSFAQLQIGKELTTSVNLTNATLSDKKAVIIYSYYKADGTMAATQYEVIEIAANQKLTKELKHTVGDLTDINTVKVMLWDSFENIVPLSPSITLN